MNRISTMENFSRKAVENFVQTVVFVDDKIYAPIPTGIVLEGKKASAPKTRKASIKSAGKSVTISSPLSTKKIEVDIPQYSPHDIQASFAKKRIVCSLHQPKKADSVGIASNTYKLCAAADIVIVDWDLFGDAGIKAKELIENLVIQSLKEYPHQLRLVLIYTDTPNLFDIADQVSEGLAEKIPEEISYKDTDLGLAFHTSNARVVVLGKPTERLERFKDFEVVETELANRTIIEFCKLADGMLQCGILLGLSKIRSQSRKIITKFHSGLDAAFLTHRALSLPHEEAFNHIPALLVAEIEAILDDNQDTPLINDSILKDWCNNRVFGQNATAKVEGVDISDFAYSFCQSGEEVLKTPGLQQMPSKKQLQYILCPDDEAQNPVTPDISSMSELAVIMSQNTPYGNQRKILKLGTILKECFGQKRYLLCLQPLCDCVRLTGKAPFLFCFLEDAGDKTTHIIYVDNKHCELTFKPTKENRRTIVFVPNHQQAVAERQDEGKTNIFRDEENNEYQWISQLKPEHGQQAAEKFAREISRVGLTESEWLHRGAKK